MPALEQENVRNRLLRLLPAAEFNVIAPHLTPVELEMGQTLHRAGDPIEHVYFVETGFISALAVLSDGHPLEVGLIGSEGVDGVSIALGAHTSFAETMCQTGGRALRMPASAFKPAADIVSTPPAVADLPPVTP